MLDKKLREALALHQKGFNCAQAVGMPFAEELGMPKELASRALEGFGAGMGSREQTCGALSGVVFLAGLKYADGDLDAPASKKATYAVAEVLGDRFSARCGSSICKAIKKERRVSCNECIECGVRLACDLVNEKHA